jgi:hypothetical protein
MASIELLDLASPAAPLRADAGVYSRESLQVGETVDDYFSTMREKSAVKHRSAEDDSQRRIRKESLRLEDIFDQSRLSMRDDWTLGASTFADDMTLGASTFADDTTLGASTAASTSMTIRTEPTLRPRTREASSKSLKKKKKRRGRSEKQPKHGTYAQIRFNGSTADVEYARIPKRRSRDEASEREICQESYVNKPLKTRKSLMDEKSERTAHKQITPELQEDNNEAKMLNDEEREKIPEESHVNKPLKTRSARTAGNQPAQELQKLQGQSNEANILKKITALLEAQRS